MDPTSKILLEAIYAALLPIVLLRSLHLPEDLRSVLLSAVVQLARVLDKPCPVVTREERRNGRVLDT